MRPLFSVVIPLYNGEQTIEKLIEKVIDYSSDYSIEIIVIDSESKDKSASIVKKLSLRYKNIKFLSIKKKDFSHGGTRNLGARLAKGKYILFFSQDAIPKNQNLFNILSDDFLLGKRVAAVFGKQVPFPNTPLIPRIEALCRFDRLDSLTDNRGLLIQTRQKPFLPYTKNNFLLWYSLFNTFAAYRKSFLSKNPFPKIDYAEDLALGKILIEKGYSKIYDKKLTVWHSHKFSLIQYFKREREDVENRIKNLKVSASPNIFCKIRKIVEFQKPVSVKILDLTTLAFYYFLKGLILIQIKLF